MIKSKPTSLDSVRQGPECMHSTHCSLEEKHFTDNACFYAFIDLIEKDSYLHFHFCSFCKGPKASKIRKSNIKAFKGIFILFRLRKGLYKCKYRYAVHKNKVGGPFSTHQYPFLLHLSTFYVTICV